VADILLANVPDSMSSYSRPNPIRRLLYPGGHR